DVDAVHDVHADRAAGDHLAAGERFHEAPADGAGIDESIRVTGGGDGVVFAARIGDDDLAAGALEDLALAHVAEVAPRGDDDQARPASDRRPAVARRAIYRLRVAQHRSMLASLRGQVDNAVIPQTQPRSVPVTRTAALSSLVTGEPPLAEVVERLVSALDEQRQLNEQLAAAVQRL